MRACGIREGLDRDPHRHSSGERQWLRPNMTLSAKHLLIESGRFFRFGVVGIAATAVYAIVAFSSVEIAGASPVLASIIGQVAAMSVSYFGHAIYSFTVKLDRRSEENT